MTLPCDRRRFVSLCAAGALAPLLNACASLVAREVEPVNGRIELPLTQYPDLREAGAFLKLMPAGSTDPIYVLVQDDSSVVALSPICTHLSCTVEVQGPLLVCPCHGSTYDRKGDVLKGPAERALTRYRVEQNERDVVIIHLLERP